MPQYIFEERWTETLPHDMIQSGIIVTKFMRKNDADALLCASHLGEGKLYRITNELNGSRIRVHEEDE